MSFFNDVQLEALRSGKYYCRECGALMEWEDEWEDVLVCPKCGFSEDSDHYGMSDDEYDSLYPTKEEVCGYDDEEDEDDEYNGEYYEEVYGELSDD